VTLSKSAAEADAVIEIENEPPTAGVATPIAAAEILPPGFD
jgi:hypothetical protein